jgi:hypothetical protein
MKYLCITLLLIFGTWFGWQRYAEHRAAEARALRESFEGYERCTASLDAAHFANHTDERDWLKARDDCRKIWFTKDAQ